MVDETRKLLRGRGRVAFIARLGAIKAEIAAGEYLVTIYERHASVLGITYSAFRKLVQRYAEDAKPARRRPYGTATTARPPPAPAPALPRPAAPSTPEGSAHARHEPARGFLHDPLERPGDRKRLLDE